MSVTEVGDIFYLPDDVLEWNIPSFSMLLRRNVTRIWSPTFIYHFSDNIYTIPGKIVPFQTSKGSLGLIMTSCCVTMNEMLEMKQNYIYLKFGVADQTGAVFKCLDGFWIEESDGNGYFEVQTLVDEEDLSNGRKRLFPHPSQVHLRLFCEGFKSENQKSLDDSYEAENACGTTTTAEILSSVTETPSNKTAFHVDACPTRKNRAPLFQEPDCKCSGFVSGRTTNTAGINLDSEAFGATSALGTTSDKSFSDSSTTSTKDERAFNTTKVRNTAQTPNIETGSDVDACPTRKNRAVVFQEPDPKCTVAKDRFLSLEDEAPTIKKVFNVCACPTRKNRVRLFQEPDPKSTAAKDDFLSLEDEAPSSKTKFSSEAAPTRQTINTGLEGVFGEDLSVGKKIKTWLKDAF